MTTPEVLLDGLCFPEGPRWRDGRLFFSDFYAHEVVAVDLEGRRERICEVPNQPSGLGWDRRGRLLVVSMIDRQLLRLEEEGLRPFADLSGHATWHCNDMVVDGDGGAYVGNFGFDHHGGAAHRLADLIRVAPDGAVSIADTGLEFPNGSAITPDGGTLVVAETRGRRLSAWDRAADGGLSNRRVWADLGETVPDGICLDEAGLIWVADPRNNEVVRVAEGGAVERRVSTGERGAFACMLGGADRRTLFICAAMRSGPGAVEPREGQIQTIDVDVAGTGWP